MLQITWLSLGEMGAKATVGWLYTLGKQMINIDFYLLLTFEIYSWALYFPIPLQSNATPKKIMTSDIFLGSETCLLLHQRLSI